MKGDIWDMHALERLSGGDTIIHRLNPTAKLLAAGIFILVVVSFDRYALGRLIPYIFYPVIMTALSETPHSMLLKRFAPALPFCLFAGISNVIFDKAAAFSVGGVTVSYGAVSLFVILLKAYLCVTAILILVAATPLSRLTGAMRRLGAPYILVAVLEMIYRYIGVLFEESHSMRAAYALRGGGKGVAIKDMGSFTGLLLLRSLDRAERVFGAMKCRGYALGGEARSREKWSRGDFIFLAAVCVFCMVFRFAGIGAILAGFSGGSG